MADKKRITLILNGTEVKARPAMTVLELANKNGVYIPTLCHDPHLKPFGACRLCVVEDEKSGAMLPSCITTVSPGMVINTESENVIEARRYIVKLILSTHPESCIVCDKGNRCSLRKIATELGIDHVEFARLRRYYPIESTNPFIERDLSKCILCGKCIRACQEIEVAGAIDYAYRGFDSKPATELDRALENSSCTFCGLCVDMCPVGALTDKPGRYKGIAKKRAFTVCPYCGSGCSVKLGIADDDIVSVLPDTRHPVNKVSLCVKGRYNPLGNAERIKVPLIKKNGEFVESTWNEAIGLVADKLNNIKDQYGDSATAVVGSLRCTNEENYLMQKFSRAVLGTNNIDTMARLGSAPALEALESVFGFGAASNSFEDIKNSEVIFVLGANPTATLPMLSQRIRQAVKFNGAKLIIADPGDPDLLRFADIHLKLKPGKDATLINTIMNVILDNGLSDKSFISKRTTGLKRIQRKAKNYPLNRATRTTGVGADEVREAALLFAQASNASIVIGEGVSTQNPAADTISSLANLALLTGNIGKEGGGVYLAAAENNLQGAWDMGCSPERLPGQQMLKDATARNRFERHWKAKLPRKRGLYLIQMAESAVNGNLKAMYVIGANPATGHHIKSKMVKALKKLDLLVVQDVVMSETAELADVVLPAAGAFEKDGTFTSAERRIQRIKKAMEPPHQALPDWKIITKLAAKMGHPIKYKSPKEIMEEIALLTPIYKGIKYGRLGVGGLQWPCPKAGHPGTDFLYKRNFKGRFRTDG
jgi:predicted molibdopterin-dependent oxidoreductase YjgC